MSHHYDRGSYDFIWLILIMVLLWFSVVGNRCAQVDELRYMKLPPPIIEPFDPKNKTRF